MWQRCAVVWREEALGQRILHREDPVVVMFVGNVLYLFRWMCRIMKSLLACII